MAADAQEELEASDFGELGVLASRWAEASRDGRFDDRKVVAKEYPGGDSQRIHIKNFSICVGS